MLLFFLVVVSSLVQPCRTCHFLKASEWNGSYSVNVVFALLVVVIWGAFSKPPISKLHKMSGSFVVSDIISDGT